MSRGPPRRYGSPAERFRGFPPRSSSRGFLGHDGPPFKRARHSSAGDSRPPGSDYGMPSFYEDDIPGFRHQEVGLGDFNDFSSISQKDIKLERNPELNAAETKVEQESEEIYHGLKRKQSSEEMSPAGAAKATPKSPQAVLACQPQLEGPSSTPAAADPGQAGRSPGAESRSTVPGPRAGQDSQAPRKESTYQPVLEDISPAKPVSARLDGRTHPAEPEKTPSETLAMTKEELLQGMERADREIAQVEQHINNLKKKKLQLEEEAAQSAEQPPKAKSPPPQQKPKSLVQKIYEENRKKAEAAHARFAKLGVALPDGKPLYNQPSDLACFHENRRRAPAIKAKLVRYFQQRRQAKEAKNRQLCKEYRTLKKAWIKKLGRLENNSKRKAKEIKVREFYEKIFPEIKKQREQEERFSRMGARSSAYGVARSEAEFIEIMDNLQEKEANERHMRTLAVDPPALLEPEERRRKFINSNGLIPDPLALLNSRKYKNIWTEKEKKIFKEKYVEYPKNFAMIKRFLENKSTRDCILYYYQTKKKEQYKQLTRKHLHRKRRRDQYGSSRDSTLSTKRITKGITLNSGPSGRGSGSEDDEDEMTDSAEESEGGEFQASSRAAGGALPQASSALTHVQMHTSKHSIRAEHVETSRWSDKEIQIARQGLRDCGRDWDAISQRVGTKTAAQCKNFYFNYKKKMNLEALLAEHEASKMQRTHYSEDELVSDEDASRGAHVAGSLSAPAHPHTKPTATSSSSPTPARETRSMKAAAAAAAAAAACAASAPGSPPTPCSQASSSGGQVAPPPHISQPPSALVDFGPRAAKLSSDAGRRGHAGCPPASYVLAGGTGQGHVMQKRGHGEQAQLVAVPVGALPVGALRRGRSPLSAPAPGGSHSEGSEISSSRATELLPWPPHLPRDYGVVQLNLRPSILLTQGCMPRVQDAAPSNRGGVGWSEAGPTECPRSLKTEPSAAASPADGSQAGAAAKRTLENATRDSGNVTVSRTSGFPKQTVIVLNANAGKCGQRNTDSNPSMPQRPAQSGAPGSSITAEHSAGNHGLTAGVSRPRSLPPFGASAAGSSREAARQSSVTPPASGQSLKPPPLIQVSRDAFPPARDAGQKLGYIDLSVAGAPREHITGLDSPRQRDVSTTHARESAVRQVRPEQFRDTLHPQPRDRADHFRDTLQPQPRDRADHFRDTLHPQPRDRADQFRDTLQPQPRDRADQFRDTLQPQPRDRADQFRDTLQPQPRDRADQFRDTVHAEHGRPLSRERRPQGGDSKRRESEAKRPVSVEMVDLTSERDSRSPRHVRASPRPALVDPGPPSARAALQAMALSTRKESKASRDDREKEDQPRAKDKSPVPHAGRPRDVNLEAYEQEEAIRKFTTMANVCVSVPREFTAASDHGGQQPPPRASRVGHAHATTSTVMRASPHGAPALYPYQVFLGPVPLPHPEYHLPSPIGIHQIALRDVPGHSVNGEGLPTHLLPYGQGVYHQGGAFLPMALHPPFHHEPHVYPHAHPHGSCEDKSARSGHPQSQLLGLSGDKGLHRTRSPRTPPPPYAHGSLEGKRTPNQPHAPAQRHLHAHEEAAPHRPRSRTPTPSQLRGFAEEKKPLHPPYPHAPSQMHPHGATEDKGRARSRTPTPSLEDKSFHPHVAAPLHPHDLAEEPNPVRVRSCTPLHVQSVGEDMKPSYSQAQLRLYGLNEGKVSPHRSRSLTPTQPGSSARAQAHSISQGRGELGKPSRRAQRTGDISDQELANPFLVKPTSVYTRASMPDLTRRPDPSRSPGESARRVRSCSPVSVDVPPSAEGFESRTMGQRYLNNVPTKMPSMSEIRSRAAIIPDLQERDSRILTRVPSPQPANIPTYPADLKKARPTVKVESAARAATASSGKKSAGPSFASLDTLAHAALEAQRAETDLDGSQPSREGHLPEQRQLDVESARPASRGEASSQPPDQLGPSSAATRYGIGTGLVPKPPPLMPITGNKFPHEGPPQMSLSVSTTAAVAVVSPRSPSKVTSPPGGRTLRAAVSPDKPPPLISHRGAVSPPQQQQPPQPHSRQGSAGPPPLISAGNTPRGAQGYADTSSVPKPERTDASSASPLVTRFQKYREHVSGAANVPRVPVRSIWETVPNIEDPGKSLVDLSSQYLVGERPGGGPYDVGLHSPSRAGTGVQQATVFRPWVTGTFQPRPSLAAAERAPGTKSGEFTAERDSNAGEPRAPFPSTSGTGVALGARAPPTLEPGDQDSTDTDETEAESERSAYPSQTAAAPSIATHHRIRQLAPLRGVAQGTPERYTSDSENTLSAEESDCAPGKEGDASQLPNVCASSEATDTAESSPAADGSGHFSLDSPAEENEGWPAKQGSYEASAVLALGSDSADDSSPRNPQEVSPNEEVPNDGLLVVDSGHSDLTDNPDVTSSPDQMRAGDSKPARVTRTLERIVPETPATVEESSECIGGTDVNTATQPRPECDEEAGSDGPANSNEAPVHDDAAETADQQIRSEGVTSEAPRSPEAASNWGCRGAALNDSTESADLPAVLSPRLSEENEQCGEEMSTGCDAADEELSKPEYCDSVASDDHSSEPDNQVASDDHSSEPDNQVPEITSETEEFPNYMDDPPAFPTFVGEFVPSASPDGHTRVPPHSPPPGEMLPDQKALSELEPVCESEAVEMNSEEESGEGKEPPNRESEEVTPKEDGMEAWVEEPEVECTRSEQEKPGSESGNNARDLDKEDGEVLSTESDDEEREIEHTDSQDGDVPGLVLGGPSEEPVMTSPGSEICIHGDTSTSVPAESEQDADAPGKDEIAFDCRTKLGREANRPGQQETSREEEGNEQSGTGSENEEVPLEEAELVEPADDALSEGEIVSSDQEGDDNPSEPDISPEDTGAPPGGAVRDLSSGDRPKDPCAPRSSEVSPAPTHENTSDAMRTPVEGDCNVFAKESIRPQADNQRENPLSPEEVAAHPYFSYIPISPPAPESPNHQSEGDRVSPVPAWPQSREQSHASSQIMSFALSQENTSVSSLAARLAAQRNPAFPYSALSINVGSAPSSARSSPVPSVSFGHSSPASSSRLPRALDQTVLLSDNYEPLSDDEESLN